MSKNRLGFWMVVSVMGCGIACFLVTPRPASLTATESQCVGNWAYISPEHPGKICIVYHFSPDRSVREEHYYLTSAWPNVPRLTMVGKWSVNNDRRLTVEPNQGVSYARDELSGWLNEFFDDGRQAWKRPVLTRFYDVKSATNSGIQIETGRHQLITMLPFKGDPKALMAP